MSKGNKPGFPIKPKINPPKNPKPKGNDKPIPGMEFPSLPKPPKK